MIYNYYQFWRNWRTQQGLKLHFLESLIYEEKSLENYDYILNWITFFKIYCYVIWEKKKQNQFLELKVYVLHNPYHK